MTFLSNNFDKINFLFISNTASYTCTSIEIQTGKSFKKM